MVFTLSTRGSTPLNLDNPAPRVNGALDVGLTLFD